MKVHFYGLCWNEVAFLPFFLRHYAFCERIVFYDHGSTDGTPDLLRAAGVEFRPWQAVASALPV